MHCYEAKDRNFYLKGSTPWRRGAVVGALVGGGAGFLGKMLFFLPSFGWHSLWFVSVSSVGAWAA